MGAMQTRIAAFTFGALLLPHATPAAGPLANCAGDREKFCASVAVGGGRVLRCLQEHVKDLSDPCKAALGDAPGGAPGAVKSACRGDAMQLCREAIGDQGRMKTCLASHAAQLSDGCKTALIAGGR